MWPVILIPLNLPPWDCMKQPFIFLSMLIPGPKSLGKDIDTYLAPLIEELNELWSDGVETFDVSCKKNFMMHAAILWTINDFPAYGDLSGWSTKGYMACPVCNEQASSIGLRSKICYKGHRRFLHKDHTWRRSKMFNGKKEAREAPKRLTGDEVLEQLGRLEDSTLGKHGGRKRKRKPEELNWTKQSIFFNLPYWSKLILRHNLDVMHIEKKICESVLGTLLFINGKTKDTIKARQYLKDMRIRKELHLTKRSDGKYLMPVACYVMTKKEKEKFIEFLKSLKFPDGYASNISRCVSSGEVKISSLKSHDCHVLLQRILPAGVRGCLNKEMSNLLAELGHFFQRLCCKKLKKTEVEKMRDDICLILCKLEKVYPPAFFDVMVHLSVHLPEEALLGGPVQFRWMYPIERSLCEFKQSVRNKAHPEGSIAEAYVAKECLTFCSMYLNGIETRFNRDDRNNDMGNDDSLSIFSQHCRPFGATKFIDLSEEEYNFVQWFVLQNCEEVEPFFQVHKEKLQSIGCRDIDQSHKKDFPIWFKEHMIHVYNEDPSRLNESLYSLACMPHRCSRKYTGCIVNGVRFMTKERDNRRKSQNSGIVAKGYHGEDVIDFYGGLNDIIQLDYVKNRHGTIFSCDWFDLGRKKQGIQQDGHIISVNITRNWYENDSYVLADQVSQVFYVNDPKLGRDWRVVLPFQHRHIYDVDEIQDEEMDANSFTNMEDEVYQESEISDAFQVVIDEMPSLIRKDVDHEDIVASLISRTTEDGESNVHEEDEIDDTLVDYCDSDEGSERSNKSEDDSDDDN
ncbi:uncharacterized protein [Euphorbia lathyris]|uniref:uncharacterized protein n=1 Tax=Euphorbia lathyris TaxID=212925 RepID=UPI0033138A60